ncbi:MAG: 4Fe-4S ferredoxin [Omnitrophica bacterium RIFCSPLOWO2_12_FULL_44_17]|uniref:Electron transfer flavoprotein-ubiquinone oxidoreductase n=1 Tax=Candidatus Danuiimicrobium aquiferis TaxID=1801832 RepID=A0A1G1KV38_9BACT|nr:MAG: 4Fe-4S ferredoxin [Omnitrophica bacterium RIFCSPHIGHO2_02_FULL_45_28]OGW96834.1 MAG: 4Fe-4S ferredoxin [Omnitrophica bacterium RIFCSPLOWO2_12_FULL_44_17]OGX03835.1 MAG: 4Fe-4S ferredoxin [Omnitrophica bacterium RIFCSPLOWO2_02_FULL_44_11]
MKSEPSIERQSMNVDIVCVGFGPATGGFLTTLSKALQDPALQPILQSKAMPGMPLQVICYERADDIGFGASGVVTKARGIRESFTTEELSQIPMAAPVTSEKLIYLLDPIGKSRRSPLLKIADFLINATKCINPFYKKHGFEVPFIPPFMNKHGGFVFSIGQFNTWVGSQLMASGAVQVWPGMPAKSAFFDGGKVSGIRLVDQGTDKAGNPDAGYMPGMDIRADLTVVGDGPVGAVGQQLDQHFGLPKDHHQREWAVGMKMVIELPEDCPLKPGTVFHTFGYPEPEIFGFFYVYPNRLASVGVFIPSWMNTPTRTSYRYLQYWLMHPYIWRYVKGGTMKSWGAKSLQESGKRGEPFLVGDGYARIGEGSGSTNVLTGSGVDEAWMTGIQLAEGVIELCKAGKPFSKENLQEAYENRRRSSWIEEEAKVAEKSRDGFDDGFVKGFIGMAISGFTGGKLNLSGKSKRLYEHFPSLEDYYKGLISPEEISKTREETVRAGTYLNSALMEKAGWPKIQYDGKLLVSHQDALLMGGKVQAAGGFADHVTFLNTKLCKDCKTKVCIEICSGQAITPGEDGQVPQFDREKCIHCGACMWTCAKPHDTDPERTNVNFRAGSGGLHSAEN